MSINHSQYSQYIVFVHVCLSVYWTGLTTGLNVNLKQFSLFLGKMEHSWESTPPSASSQFYMRIKETHKSSLHKRKLHCSGSLLFFGIWNWVIHILGFIGCDVFENYTAHRQNLVNQSLRCVKPTQRCSTSASSESSGEVRARRYVLA